MNNLKQSMQQFSFFIKDYQTLSGSKKIRMFYLWLARASIGILFYRIDRSMYLLFGSIWKVIRIPFFPIFILIDIYSNIEISYKADIGHSFSILHPAMGIVISGYAKIGKGFTLVGGNVIGGKLNIKEEPFIIGDDVSLGANAVILGPCIVSDNTSIGACALVLKDTEKNSKMVGVPAHNINIMESING